MGSRESQFIFSPKLAQPVKKKKIFHPRRTDHKTTKKEKSGLSNTMIITFNIPIILTYHLIDNLKH